MPPKKANGFMTFTLEWKAKYGRNCSLSQATTEAGKIWANMDAQQRGPYNQRAKQEKVLLNCNQEKLTCTGTPITQMEREKQDQETKERLMKRDIETTVSKSVKRDELEHQSYYFIMVNYFTKTLKGGVYVPAELSVCEYSLKGGIMRMYHTLINPGVNIYGHQYEAQHHSETTHNLPLPPNALGEKNLGSIYNDVLNFIRDESSNDYPPIYTLQDGIHIVESVLDFLKADVGANNIDLKIYRIQYLFYIMKEATCEAGELEKPTSFYITDAYFDRDTFEYAPGIACQYHEDIDKSKYCSQSYVTRWGFMFSDYMCADIAIPLIPGRHCPKNTNLNAIITPAPSTFADNESFISMDTTASYATKAVASSKIYYDDKKPIGSDISKTTYTNDFPALGARKKTQSTSQMSNVNRQKKIRNMPDCASSDFGSDDFDTDHNPWASRSRNIPREPKTSNFNMDDLTSKDDLTSELEDFNSVASFGRGRASTYSLLMNTTGGSGVGRGRFLK